MMIDLRWLLGAPYLDPILYTPTEEELNEIEIIWSSYVATLDGGSISHPLKKQKKADPTARCHFLAENVDMLTDPSVDFTTECDPHSVLPNDLPPSPQTDLPDTPNRQERLPGLSRSTQSPKTPAPEHPQDQPQKSDRTETKSTTNTSLSTQDITKPNPLDNLTTQYGVAPSSEPFHFRSILPDEHTVLQDMISHDATPLLVKMSMTASVAQSLLLTANSQLQDEEKRREDLSKMHADYADKMMQMHRISHQAVHEPHANTLPDPKDCPPYDPAVLKLVDTIVDANRNANLRKACLTRLHQHVETKDHDELKGIFDCVDETTTDEDKTQFAELIKELLIKSS
jgi:hypothetical protein